MTNVTDFTIKQPFRDFAFICQNTAFYVDRSILYDSSRVFKMFFDDNPDASFWTDNDFEHKTVNIFLNAVYNLFIPYTYNSIHQIYLILDKYDARPDIRSDIIDKCIDKYSVSKETIELIQTYRPESLKLLCKRYMIDQSLSIFDSTDINVEFWETCLYSISIRPDPYMYWLKVFSHIQDIDELKAMQAKFWERYKDVSRLSKNAALRTTFKGSPDAGL